MARLAQGGQQRRPSLGDVQRLAVPRLHALSLGLPVALAGQQGAESGEILLFGV